MLATTEATAARTEGSERTSHWIARARRPRAAIAAAVCSASSWEAR